MKFIDCWFQLAFRYVLDIDVWFEKNKEEILVTYTGTDENAKFRVRSVLHAVRRKQSTVVRRSKPTKLTTKPTQFVGLLNLTTVYDAEISNYLLQLFAFYENICSQKYNFQELL